MEGLSVSSNVVTGKRVAWWRGVLAQPGFAVFAFASPPALAFALYKLVAHHHGMDGLGYAFWGGLAVVAAIGCLLLNMARTGGQPIEAPCPVCNSRGIWSYTPPVDHPDPRGQLCESCGAYDGTNGLEVRELRLDATGEFMIDRARLKDMKRDDKGHAVLAMPAFCAICGSEDASGRRKIDVGSYSNGGTELTRQVNYAATGHRGQVTPSYSDAQRLELDHIDVPVCERHMSSELPPVRADNDASLRFASYRYYKAFCGMNQIAAPNGTKGFPSARAVDR